MCESTSSARTGFDRFELDEALLRGIRAAGLQGNMSQNARDGAMGGLRARGFDVLVATDIAARGIDVSGVSRASIPGQGAGGAAGGARPRRRSLHS